MVDSAQASDGATNLDFKPVRRTWNSSFWSGRQEYCGTCADGCRSVCQTFGAQKVASTTVAAEPQKPTWQGLVVSEYNLIDYQIVL
jgi:hypothetical protein